MKFTKEMLGLYLVTDRRWLGDRDFVEVLKESIDGGVRMIQLREKDLTDKEFLNLGFKVKELCRKENIPFIINDNVEVAKKLDADGLHIGQDDMAYEKAREVLGKDKIIGVSCGNIEEAILAEKNGADYIGVGAVFRTGSKDDAEYTGLEGLEQISKNVEIPIVAIGGINKDNILDMKDIKISGVSLISAILKGGNIKSNAEELYKLSMEAFYEGDNI